MKVVHYPLPILDSWQISDSFLSLPLSSTERNTEPGAPSSLFVAAHCGASPPMVATLGPGVIGDAPTASRQQRERTSRRRGKPRRERAVKRPPGRLAPMQHRHHQQPLAEPGSGTEVPGVGADSRRPSGARVEPRDDLSPARAHTPGAADRSAARSPLCDSSTRCFGHGRPRTTQGGLGRNVIRPVEDGMRHVGALNVS